MSLMRLAIPILGFQRAMHLPANTVDRKKDEFSDFCQINRELRIERSAREEIIADIEADGSLHTPAGA